MEKIVDVHTHNILPEYYQAMKDAGGLEEDGFPIPTPDEWSIEKHLEFMDKAGILWSLSFISSPQPYYGDDTACCELMHRINTRLAGYKKAHPNRFGFAAHLPFPIMDKVVDEAIYCLDELGADAVKMGSNLRGIYLGDPVTEPLWKELNKRNAIVCIHPQVPSPYNPNVFTGGPIPIYEFLADTTRAVLNYIANGFCDKYPHVRLIIPHNGSFLPNVLPRFKDIMGTLMGFGRMSYVDIDSALKNNRYFDTGGSPDPNLDFLISLTTPDHIMCGSDFPFKRLNNALYSVNFLRGYVCGNPKLAPFKDYIFRNNAIRLFKLDILKEKNK